MGAEKFTKLLLFLLTDLSFVVLSICSSLKMILLNLLIFSKCWQLNTLSGHIAPNYIWGLLCNTHIIFVRCNISHSRKEVRNSFVVKFFTGMEYSSIKESSKQWITP
jgi:hypothetical protein